MLRRAKNSEIEKELQKEAARDQSLRAKHPQENGVPPRLPSPPPAKSSVATAPVSEKVRLPSTANGPNGPRSFVAPPKQNTEEPVGGLARLRSVADGPRSLVAPPKQNAEEPVGGLARLRSVADGPRSLVAPPKQNTEPKWKASPFSDLQLFTLILKD